jgi:TPP-dependent pyruvate/acetoin dehydrogenase alpha subunit
MIEIRLFEEAAIETFRQKLWKGSLHQCIGQEAIDATFGVVLQEKDYLVSSHRGHGHVLAKGVPPRILMAELFGKQTGMCSGRGGSMHAIDPERRVYPQGLVGSGAYLAAGIGLAIALRKGSEVVGCAFGDGAINAGGCHEGMTIAAIHKAPVLFVCENNGMAVSTRIGDVLPVPRISDRAPAYGMPGKTVDGTDAVQVLEAMEQFVRRARDGGGPSFLEATCYRWHGHTVWDTSTYRTKEENEAWKSHDPIPHLAAHLRSRGALTDGEDRAWQDEVRQEIQEAVEFAKSSPAPESSREDIQRLVYVESEGASE